MTPLFNLSCRIDPLPLVLYPTVSVAILRLDLVHPVVSGNKWFKLNYYLGEATAAGKTILTFGGAYSNHIVATAAAAKMAGLKSIGVIRGERAPELSQTLTEAKAFGMELYFISRKAYQEKTLPDEIANQQNEFYIIPDGGYGLLGMEGAKDILLQNQTSAYTHIVSAVGTGTTLAGLAGAAGDDQHVIGISVLKNNFSLQNEVEELVLTCKRKNVRILHDYHFGGYAKYTAELIHFMNDFFRQTSVPTDFVYTGKAFFGVIDLIQQQFFAPGSKILLVHTGGLQGNRSLAKGTLIFG
ncbi:MAG TPA: pyridoxal-phosphate dependent enzyme [Flavisolibacter sp.]|jgi:1-aminocyclopropane-1-carboxylate deaminase|nr:pyridoxal-phosphate dependent enzyme [Flavisolibacter sp.]